MTRPLLEVADIVRAQGDRFVKHNFRWIHWAHPKVLRAIARCRTASLAGIVISALAVAIAPSHLIVVAIAIAPSVRVALATSGSWLGRTNFCPSPMSMLVFTLPHQLSQLGRSRQQQGLVATCRDSSNGPRGYTAPVHSR
jgi:hypothetical protein